MALAWLNGMTDDEIRKGMKSFKGVDRRFDFKIKNDHMVFLSDYAHHPNEIEQSVKSIRELYQDKKIAAVFQPHLYTRTRDFYKEFADSLSLLDKVYLCDIYPAREAPIPGVTSQLIYDNLRPGMERQQGLAQCAVIVRNCVSSSETTTSLSPSEGFAPRRSVHLC